MLTRLYYYYEENCFCFHSYELKHTPTAALTTEQFKSLENAPDPADGSLPGGDSVQEAGAHGQLQMALPEEARATTSLPPSLVIDGG